MAATFFDYAWRRAVNVSGTAIRASEEHPILVEGFQYTLKVGDVVEVWFFITNVMDFRTLPGFDDTESQIPYHHDNNKSFVLDSEQCPDESP